VGSDGHRRLLKNEGVAYTLRFGPPLEFVTPNLADTKQPLLLLVQGEEFRFGDEVSVSYKEMAQRVAGDPTGQAIVFELMMRLFFEHVLGLREGTVGWRRGEVRTKAAKAWASHGVAADMSKPGIYGAIAAAFGAVEAQGRGSLHPHILVWLLHAPHSALLDLLVRDGGALQERLELWMRELLSAIGSVQESAVTEMPRRMQGGVDTAGAQVAPLPFGPKEQRFYMADGARETAAAAECCKDEEAGEQPLYFFAPDAKEGDAWKSATRPSIPLRNRAGEVVDRETWAAEYEEESRGMWARPISRWSSGRCPAYRLGERDRSPPTEATACPDPPGEGALKVLREAIPADEWLRSFCQDARDLVIGCAIHVCSPSCFKYHSKKGSHICRHGFYHVVTLSDEDWNNVRRRRRGKALRGCMAIFRDTRFGMAGRILTFQLHPWECPSNYAALVAMRCNVDVQDMRRVLPPHLWMPDADLEPTAREAEGEAETHGAYPQRVHGCSVGRQDDWGWMQHLGTTDRYTHEVVAFTDWKQIFMDLSAKPRMASGKAAGLVREA